jgi:hypothetical protein
MVHLPDQRKYIFLQQMYFDSWSISETKTKIKRNRERQNVGNLSRSWGSRKTTLLPVRRRRRRRRRRI